VRRPRRQAAGRIRQGRRKKLRSAFRWQISRKAPEQEEWVAELIKAYPEERWLQRAVEKPPADAEFQVWHAFYLRAWDVMRADRQYGAFGGETPISFLALDAYARRYGIEGEAFERYLAFMQALDEEWLAFVGERAKSKKTDD
jgi:hypothetical protein